MPIEISPQRPPSGARPRVHHSRPWHRGSHFGEGPRRSLSADQRRCWTTRAELERRAGRLTALHVLVGRALLRRLGEDGQCDPSHATLAADAGCGVRTVGRALAALREQGLLTWERRLVRRPWPAGGPGASRAEQTSNAYVLLLPEGQVAPRMERRPGAGRRRSDCGGQADRETPSQYIPSLLPVLDEITRKRLEAIQVVRTVQRQQEWLVQRAERWRIRG